MPGSRVSKVRISPEDVQALVERGEHVVFVDARSATAYAEATEEIPGSVRIPPQEARAHLHEVPPGKTIVAYCT